MGQTEQPKQRHSPDGARACCVWTGPQGPRCAVGGVGGVSPRWALLSGAQPRVLTLPETGVRHKIGPGSQLQIRQRSI